MHARNRRKTVNQSVLCKESSEEETKDNEHDIDFNSKSATDSNEQARISKENN